jgi:hypothetical protein
MTAARRPGQASYVDVLGGDAVAERAGWFYPHPTPAYAGIADHVALYPGLMDRCTVDGEVVRPQPGGFYGGWVTSKVARSRPTPTRCSGRS